MEDDQKNTKWKTTKKIQNGRQQKFQNATTTMINNSLIQYNLKTK